MTYSVEPDRVYGRLHWTDLGAYKVSTVDLEERDNDPVTGKLLALCDSLLGRDGRYETAVIGEGPTRVVASAASQEEALSNHRRAVENLLDGGECLPDKPPPLLRALTRMED